MNDIYYIKFINFLKKHNLYDDKFFKYFWKESIFISLFDDDYSFLIGGTAIVVDRKNRITNITPHMPYINCDKSVAIGIYTYVQALIQITRIGKKENYDVYYNYILPMFYEKIYINENFNDELFYYENKMRNNLSKDNFDFYTNILNSVDSLFYSYSKKKLNEKQIARRAKRLAKESSFLLNNNSK